MAYSSLSKMNKENLGIPRLRIFKKFISTKLNSLTINVPHHIETSQLICIANQLTGFYMMGKIGR